MNIPRGPLPTEKVAKCFRLFGSDKEGECLAALAALGRVLSAAGYDFNDFAETYEAGGGVADEPDWLRMTGWLRANAYRLSDKERAFVGNMARLVEGGLRPSDKQSQWIEDLFCREIQRAAA
jgi:hypothetical protein